jgi:glutamate dehydrogenase (NADP+)
MEITVEFQDYVTKYPNAKFVEGKRPWEGNVIFHQLLKRIERRRSKSINRNDVSVLAEGANTCHLLEAVTVFKMQNIIRARKHLTPGR